MNNKEILKAIVASILLICAAANSMAAQPIIPRTAPNTAPDPLIADASEWVLSSALIFDGTTSRTADGSGSFVLTAPFYPSRSGSDSFYSRQLAPVEPEKIYTYGGYIKSDSWPSAIPAIFIQYRDINGAFIKNSGVHTLGVTQPNTWQEFAIQFQAPAEAASARIYGQMYRQHIEYSGGNIWFDDLYFGEGISYEQPPSAKKPFTGDKVRVDSLGNIEKNKDGVWQPFFPLCIYAIASRPDWTFYSEQGFNCNMWAGSASIVQRAKDATSSFNPDGMMSGFELAGYIVPTHSNYNNIPFLEDRIVEIKQPGLEDSLLHYYWDNENAQHSEWNVPIAVTNKVRELNTGHPIYTLVADGLSRKYNNDLIQLTDIVGHYVGNDKPRGATAISNSNNIEGQISPVVVAQINYFTGEKFKARLYAAIAKGAKALGIWKDDYNNTSSASDRIEETPWWDDFPNIRNEIDQMLPLIRQPHWTEWTISSSSQLIDLGTRDYQGDGYTIIANSEASDVTTTLSITGLSYVPTTVRDYFSDANIATVQNSQFTITIPAYGTAVYRLSR